MMHTPPFPYHDAPTTSACGLGSGQACVGHGDRRAACGPPHRAVGELLDEADRRARFQAVREAYASTDASYREETEAWDSLADDGLHT
jgi:hypothetical protein